MSEYRKHVSRTRPVAGIGAILIAGLVCGAGPQPQVAAPVSTLSFEVASIKPLKSAEGAFHFNVLPERLDVKDMNLRFLIEEAYDLPDFQVSGPDSLTSHHYDIAAKASGPVSRADMRIMLRNLLIERFHLATHWDTRAEPLYRLEALPGRPRMEVAETGHAVANSPMQDETSIRFMGPMSMRQLAQGLARYAGKPVLDVTSLEGYFKISLTFARQDLDASLEAGPTAPLLDKAVQEQLGLRLVPGKEPVKILIVDHVDDEPVAN